MANSQLLAQMIDKLVDVTAQVSPEERHFLQNALSLFRDCSKGEIPTGFYIQQEMQEQCDWIDTYSLRIQRHAQYRCAPNGILLPIMEDVDDLLCCFAVEILEGAIALSEIIGLPKSVSEPWVQVMRRHNSSSQKSDNLESTVLSELEESWGDAHDNFLSDALTYKYDYF